MLEDQSQNILVEVFQIFSIQSSNLHTHNFPSRTVGPIPLLVPTPPYLSYSVVHLLNKYLLTYDVLGTVPRAGGTVVSKWENSLPSQICCSSPLGRKQGIVHEAMALLALDHASSFSCKFLNGRDYSSIILIPQNHPSFSNSGPVT